MTDPDKWLTSWRSLGALSVSRHDLAKEGLTVSAFLPLAALIQAAQELKQARYSLLDISALEAKEGFVVTYHFDSLDQPARLAIRILAPKKKPLAPSLWSIFQGAEWHEREAADFFGLVFDGNPNLVPLLLPDPDEFTGPPPLRKAEADLAPVSKLGLLAQVEILDPDFGELLGLAQVSDSRGGQA
ncbi:MAG: NADH-quinone oxidoreductase subunit C [Deltaproteobacteria bacterium]|jgi:NADH-quinone oxidoreductase subunit C|nr:NADH-quinone oxidoreductase subunit C [Deltaproteobacteria bacterium]